ncbi:TlpA disulfide reductase family protein [Rhodovibrionaceae bacterium A322]
MGMGKRKLFALFLAAGLLFVFGNTGPQPVQAQQQPPLQGLLKDNFALFDQPPPAPDTAFGLVTDGSEKSITLAHFRGRVVLLNFWATWCAPCVREMPSLNRLQAKYKDRGLVVVTASNDRRGIVDVAPFYADLGLDALGFYLDPRAELARALAVRGLPTTFLIDQDGRVIGGMQGGLEWDSPEVETLVEFYLNELPAKT